MKLQFTILLFLFGGLAMGQDISISLASDIWPPFTNTEGNQSIATDLVQEGLSRMNIKTTLVFEPFDNVLSGLRTNTYNGSSALWKVSDREEYLLYSEPFLQNQLMLVGRKGITVDNLTMVDLTGKRVGVVAGYAYSDNLLSDTSISLVYSKNDQQNVEKLFSNTIDFLLVDDLVLSYMLKYEMNNIMDALAISENPFDTKELYFAVSKKLTNASEIISGFNAQIDSMILDGTYHTILGMQWIQADVNNDGVPEMVLNGESAGKESPMDAYALFHDENAASGKGYYVNGAYYSNWDEVPERFKTDPLYVAPPEYYSPGIHIKF